MLRTTRPDYVTIGQWMRETRLEGHVEIQIPWFSSLSTYASINLKPLYHNLSKRQARIVAGTCWNCLASMYLSFWLVDMYPLLYECTEILCAQTASWVWRLNWIALCVVSALESCLEFAVQNRVVQILSLFALLCVWPTSDAREIGQASTHYQYDHSPLMEVWTRWTNNNKTKTHTHC